MDWNAFAQEVHRNAVEHGFWEGERKACETFALIHSEWSEALEEYRAGRPMVWHDEEKGHKPEGIAVELVDGCIRILDMLAYMCVAPLWYDSIDDYSADACEFIGDDDNKPFVLICVLHELTAKSMRLVCTDNESKAMQKLLMAVGMVDAYLRLNSLDPEALMCEKHEYNKTRPYKHGKKC